MATTFYFKQTPKGYRAMCDLFELSIHKGLTAWGKSQDRAIVNLISKWNRLTKMDANKKLPPGVSVGQIKLVLKNI